MDPVERGFSDLVVIHMKLLTSLLLLLAVSAFGAVPSYDKFIGAGGITVTKNPPNGTVIIDGSGVVASGTNSSIRASTNATAVTVAATNVNYTAGESLVLRGTNIGSTAHINYALAPDVSVLNQFTVGGIADLQGAVFVGGDADFGAEVVFNAAVVIPAGAVNGYVFTSDGVGSGTWQPKAAGTNVPIGQALYHDATFGVDATAGRTNLLRPFLTASNAVAKILSGDTLVVRGGTGMVHSLTSPDATGNTNTSLTIANRNNIRIVGEPGAVWQMSGRSTNFGASSAPMFMLRNVTNAIIEGMTFIGVRTNGVVAQDAAFWLVNCNHVQFLNCRFINWQGHAISSYGETTTCDTFTAVGCEFRDIGGTNHVTLGQDGTAIDVNARNFISKRNRFYYCHRNHETFSNGDSRLIAIEGNISEGCYGISILFHATNTSEVRIVNNIENSYATNYPPGTAGTWISAYGGSNVVVAGNTVNGYGAAIGFNVLAGAKFTDWQIYDNDIHDCTYFAMEMHVPTGVAASIQRVNVRVNRFVNTPFAALWLSGDNCVAKDNFFFDCNTTIQPTGVIRAGAVTDTNVVNMSIVGNWIYSSAVNSTGIVIYANCSSNVVHGNEVDRRYTNAIHNAGVGTRTRPVNLIAPGKMLYSNTNGDEAPVTIGSGVAFDGSTGTLTGTGSGGGTNFHFDAAQFTVGGGSNVAIAAGAIMPFFYADNGIVYGAGTPDYGLYYDTGIDTLYYQDQRFAPNYTNIFGISNGFANFFVSPVLNSMPASSLLRTDAGKRISAVTVGANLTWDGTTLAATGGGGSGESNYNADASVTNATKIGLVHGKTGVTNTLRSIQAGNNIVLTNQGTNIVIASTAGVSGIIAGNSNQIPYLDHTGTNYQYGSGPLSQYTNGGFAFRRTGPNAGYGGLMVFADSPMALLTIGHPNAASEIATLATALQVSNRYDGAGFKQELIKIDAVDTGSGSDPTSALTTWRNWAGGGVGTDTIVAEIRKDGQMTLAGGLSTGTGGQGSASFSTNFTLQGIATITPSVLRTPTNANPGVLVALPVAGITNQAVAVPLTAGQYLTYNGTSYVGSNLPAADTNAYGRIIGAGTDYSWTTSLERIVFGTTSLAVTLPSAGTYELSARITMVGTAGSVLDGVVCTFTNVTSGGAVFGKTYKELFFIDTGLAMIEQVTVSAATVIHVYGNNVTSARGKVYSTDSALMFRKL